MNEYHDAEFEESDDLSEERFETKDASQEDSVLSEESHVDPSIDQEKDYRFVPAQESSETRVTENISDEDAEDETEGYEDEVQDDGQYENEDEDQGQDEDDVDADEHDDEPAEEDDSEDLDDGEDEYEDEDQEQDEDDVDEQLETPPPATSAFGSLERHVTEQQDTEAIAAVDRHTCEYMPIPVDEATLPCGMLVNLAENKVLIDAMAGRSNALGFDRQFISPAMVQIQDFSTTDSARWMEKDRDDPYAAPQSEQTKTWINSSSDTVRKAIQNPAGIPADLIQVWPSADAAIDIAISMARRLKGDSCYRTIAMVGSDHGRTGMCRSAAGIPELQEGFGPMMAGFTHVPMGDEKAFGAAIDEQTACVLVSPVNLNDAAIPANAQYLINIRKKCDEQKIPLIIDETQVVFGATGRPGTFQMLADLTADVVIFSAGLFPGISGGLLLGNQIFAKAYSNNLENYPVHTSILCKVLNHLLASECLTPFPDDIHPIAIKIAEAISGFEFIRDINVTGLTIGIESDIESSQIVAAAKRHGLRIATSGPTAIRLQPPLKIKKIEEDALIDRISCTMETLEREFSDPSL
jgi:acetylornithine/succinyldiaminopimelate/putrescine aminotransferase